MCHQYNDGGFNQLLNNQNASYMGGIAHQQALNQQAFARYVMANQLAPTPGPYQSDSLNRKLQEAKEWLAGRTKQA